jgi:hypothetical protein
LYKSQNTLKQCYNCQKFCHVWAHCKQPPPPRLLVVWGRPHAQRLHGEGECVFNSGMLQLPAGGKKYSTSRQLPRLQACQGRDVEEAAENTQKHNWKGHLIYLYEISSVLRRSAPRPG